MAAWLRTTLRKAVIITPIALTIEDRLVTVLPVRGTSMEPTLQDGDWVVVDKLSPWLEVFPRGAVVTLWSPQDPHALLTKRLVAKEGDWLVVPGREQFERMAKGRCWIEGDNRSASTDSMKFGQVPLALVQGIGVAVCWPPWHAAKLRDKQPRGRVIKTNDPIALAREAP